MYLTKMRKANGGLVSTDTFTGYDHNRRTPDGAWWDMTNMSVKDYPLLATREARRVLRHLSAPGGIAAKEKLALVDGEDIIYGGETVHMVLKPGVKQLVSMGAYLLVWPDKKWLNTADLTHGDMEASTSTLEDVQVTLCREGGDEMTIETIAATAPENPADGELWLDISVPAVPVLKEWSTTNAMWVQVPSVYIKFAADGIGAGFALYDGVTLSDLTGDMAQYNGSHVLKGVGDDYIVIEGILATDSLVSSGITIKRTVPDMDYVVECDNRIWGCKYGTVDGKPVNEIYASKLGDFKNWQCYQGLATDSYAVSRGSDGTWTGAAVLQGHPLFFKENYIEKVYPSASGAHQIVTTIGRGVQQGSWRSIATVGETLFYKAVEGVMAYTGALPVNISKAFGEAQYSDARAGVGGELYYISMRDTGDDKWHLFTFDTAKNMWCREDGTKAMAFATVGGKAVWIDERTGDVVSSSGGTDDVAWSVTSGAMGYELPNNKYISRFIIRAETEGNITMELSRDNGPFLEAGTWYGDKGVRSFVIPVPQARCDHLRLRLWGTKECRIYSIARYLQGGSDVHRR